MDAVLLLLAFGVCLLAPFAIAKLWFWFYFWLSIGLILAVFELVSFIMTGKTMSQKFWAFIKSSETKTWQKWLIFIGMSIFWIYLLIHLFMVS